jgi:hypothetical protein
MIKVVLVFGTDDTEMVTDNLSDFLGDCPVSYKMDIEKIADPRICTDCEESPCFCKN